MYSSYDAESHHNEAIQAEKLDFMKTVIKTPIGWAEILVLLSESELNFRAEGLLLLAPSKTDTEHTLTRSFLNLYLNSSVAPFFSSI